MRSTQREENTASEDAEHIALYVNADDWDGLCAYLTFGAQNTQLAIHVWGAEYGGCGSLFANAYTAGRMDVARRLVTAFGEDINAHLYVSLVAATSLQQVRHQQRWPEDCVHFFAHTDIVDGGRWSTVRWIVSALGPDAPALLVELADFVDLDDDYLYMFVSDTYTLGALLDIGVRCFYAHDAWATTEPADPLFTAPESCLLHICTMAGTDTRPGILTGVLDAFVRVLLSHGQDLVFMWHVFKHQTVTPASAALGARAAFVDAVHRCRAAEDDKQPPVRVVGIGRPIPSLFECAARSLAASIADDCIE